MLVRLFSFLLIALLALPLEETTQNAEAKTRIVTKCA